MKTYQGPSEIWNAGGKIECMNNGHALEEIRVILSDKAIVTEDNASMAAWILDQKDYTPGLEIINELSDEMRAVVERYRTHTDTIGDREYKVQNSVDPQWWRK